MLLSHVFKKLRASPHDSSLLYDNSFFSLYSAEKVFFLILDQILQGQIPPPLLVQSPSSSISLDPENALAFLTEVQCQLLGIGLHAAFKENLPLPESLSLPYQSPENEEYLPEIFGYIYSGYPNFSKTIIYRAVFLPDKEVFLLASSENLDGTVLFVLPPYLQFPLKSLPDNVNVSPEGYRDLLLVSALLDHIVGDQSLPLSHFVLFSDDERKNLLIWLSSSEKRPEWENFFIEHVNDLKKSPESFLNSLLFS